MPLPLPDGAAIRLARPDDLASLREIELAAAAMFRSAGIEGTFLDETQPIEALAAAALEQRLWVSTHDTRCVGFAIARRLEDGEAWLEEIDVHPAFGRRGLGRALVEGAIAWARDGGAPSIALATFREVAWNAPFYARIGFREVGGGALSPALAAIVDEERRRGLPLGRRVVMRLPLATASGRR